ncbi:MAG TPA: hypothetical protein VFD17_01935 [Clostridia bacterium]|nr:hypothetical protein [Clostridia bacterium]
MYDNFMTVDMLTTFVGLVAAVGIIVQFTKSIIKEKLSDVYVRLYTFAIALGLSFVYARAGNGPEGIILTVINAIIVSVSAMGAYEIIADPKAEKSK